MDSNHSLAWRQIAGAVLLAGLISCGGGGGSAPAGSTSGGGDTPPPPPQPLAAPVAVYPIPHPYKGASWNDTVVPSTWELAAGSGQLFFINNGSVQTFNPATGETPFGPRTTGRWLVYEKGLWAVGGGTWPMAETLVNGAMVQVPLGGYYGWANSTASDGRGNLYVVAEGHRGQTTDPAVAAMGANLLKVNVDTHAVTPMLFRPWGPDDEARSVAFPYSGLVVDPARNAAWILSYFHHDITRIDLNTGGVTRYADARLNESTQLLLDAQGGVVFDHTSGLVRLSPTGEFSQRVWPSDFSPYRGPNGAQRLMALDDKGRIWVAGYGGRLVCFPESGTAKLYSFSYTAGGGEGWVYPGTLVWSQGRLWLSNNNYSWDAVGNLLEFQVPPEGSRDLPSAPAILTQPQDQRVGQYRAAQLSLEASGNGTLTYQWARNGVPIPWATTRNLDVSFMTEAEAGNYVCQVTNALYGQEQSGVTRSAVLGLIPDPVIGGFSASSSITRAGQPVSLSPWFSGGTGRVDPGGWTVTSGIPLAVAPSATTTYRLSVANDLGVTLAAETTVSVEDPGTAISAFSAVPPVVDFGQTTSLAWLTQWPLTGLTLQDDLGLAGPLDVLGRSALQQVPTRRQSFLLTAETGGAKATASVSTAARGLDGLAGWPGGQGALDGKGSEARMSHPGPMTVRADGTLIFAEEFDPVIRQVTPDGQVTTLCGGYGAVGDADGPAASARFSKVAGLALTQNGLLYILDEVPVPGTLQGQVKLKQMDASGQVTTLQILGVCGSGGRGDMTFDLTGNLLVPLQDSNQVLRVSPSGVVSVAASGVTYPRALGVKPDGRLIVLSGMGWLYEVGTDGVAIERWPTIAPGDPQSGKPFGALMGLAASAAGDVYLACSTGVYTLDEAFQARSLAQSQGSVYGSGYYTSVTVTPQGDLWASHEGMGAELVRISPGSAPVSLAGLIRPYPDQADPVAPDVFATPSGLALGPNRTVFVADGWLGKVRQVTRSGQSTDVPLGTMVSGLYKAPIYCDTAGRLYFSSLNDLRRFDPATGLTTAITHFSLMSGIRDGGLQDARTGEIRGIVGDRQGTLYFLDTVSEGDYTIAELYVRKVTPGGMVVTLAGGRYGHVDGTGSSARFKALRGITLHPSGDLIIVDQGSHAIRRMTPEGVVSTVAGGAGAGWVDGPASEARFRSPGGVAVDSKGNIFVADTENAAIRLVTPDGQVSTLLGNPSQPGTRAGSPAHAGLYRPQDIVVNADGDLLVTDSGQVLQFTAPLGP
ncbi:hypothetical protein [Geothrix sp. SG200]|uniref:hypothetical protein n=1 Tax=Geothrix sp. SG200 TaxID=2922865 RepID=UPI001FADD8F8|nr:hypothetical protein [Geothrix sp. SG200]